MKKIILETLASFTYEELQQILIDAAKSKYSVVGEELKVHFRWGEPMENIYATIDVVKEIQEINEEDPINV